jgi:hypothetical protein
MDSHHSLEWWPGKSSFAHEPRCGARKFFQKYFRADSGCPTRTGTMARMKKYSVRYRRRTLLPVPYSVRPDRLERGIKMLRALRLSLAAQPVHPRVQQCEFDFALRNAA